MSELAMDVKGLLGGTSAARWLPALPVLASLLWFSWPTLTELHSRWIGIAYSHGYLILGLSVLLAMNEIRRIPLVAPTPSMAGTVVLAMAVTLVVIGDAATTAVVAQAGLPILWFSAIWAVAGRRNAACFISPLAYLYFAIPVWDLINYYLQGLTVVVVSSWLRVAEIPALIEDTLIHIPSGSFEVEGGCSGLHFLIVGFALGAYLALARHERWTSRLALIWVAILLALFVNWARVFLLVVIGHISSMRHYLVAGDHYYFGWVLFLVVCLVPLMLFDRWLPLPHVSAVSAAPSQSDPTCAPRDLFFFAARLVPALCVAMTGVWLQARVLATEESVPPTLTMPRPENWRQLGQWDDATSPVFHRADLEISQRFSLDSDRVAVYIAAYARQTPGREVVYFANRPEGNRARIRTARPFVLAAPPAEPVVLRELEVEDEGGRKRVIWFGQNIGGRWARSDLQAKLWQVIGKFMGENEGRIIVLSAACDHDGCDVARSGLRVFVEAGADSVFSPSERREP